MALIEVTSNSTISKTSNLWTPTTRIPIWTVSVFIPCSQLSVLSYVCVCVCSCVDFGTVIFDDATAWVKQVRKTFAFYLFCCTYKTYTYNIQPLSNVGLCREWMQRQCDGGKRRQELHLLQKSWVRHHAYPLLPHQPVDEMSYRQRTHHEGMVSWLCCCCFAWKLTKYVLYRQPCGTALQRNS